VYLRNIIGDHPFSDGNKRTAITVCGIFLTRNGASIIVEPQKLEFFAVQVATEHLDIKEIASWLEAYSGST
jgi:death-on-curing protein